MIGVPVTNNNFTAEPLITLRQKYCFPLEGSETYELMLETHEQEGDIVLSDYIDESLYGEDIAQIEALGSVMSHDVVIPPELWDALPAQVKEKIGSDTIQILGCMIFSPTMDWLYQVAYIVQNMHSNPIVKIVPEL